MPPSFVREGGIFVNLIWETGNVLQPYRMPPDRACPGGEMTDGYRSFQSQNHRDKLGGDEDCLTDSVSKPRCIGGLMPSRSPHRIESSRRSVSDQRWL